MKHKQRCYFELYSFQKGYLAPQSLHNDVGLVLCANVTGLTADSYFRSMDRDCTTLMLSQTTSNLIQSHVK